MNVVELLFLGTGTSAGVPMIGCHCEICTSADPHDKRNRPSVVISNGQTRVLVDTTPELRIQCLTHADHIMGLDDVRRFNAILQGPLDVWADGKTHQALKRCFGYAFQEPRPEMKVFRPHLVPRLIEGTFEIGPMKWQPIPLLHGDMPILGFRIGKLAYCTDVSEIPESSFGLLEDLDVLVLDALQPQKHTTHFSLEEAIEAARRIAARQTLFTHIAHRMAHEPTNRSLPESMKLAFDGQRVEARL